MKEVAHYHKEIQYKLGLLWKYNRQHKGFSTLSRLSYMTNHAQTYQSKDRQLNNLIPELYAKVKWQRWVGLTGKTNLVLLKAFKHGTP